MVISAEVLHHERDLLYQRVEPFNEVLVRSFWATYQHSYQMSLGDCTIWEEKRRKQGNAGYFARIVSEDPGLSQIEVLVGESLGLIENRALLGTRIRTQYEDQRGGKKFVRKYASVFIPHDSEQPLLFNSHDAKTAQTSLVITAGRLNLRNESQLAQWISIFNSINKDFPDKDDQFVRPDPEDLEAFFTRLAQGDFRKA